MKFERGVTHVIFFDIEYYVPREHRNGPGLRANPYLDGSFVMGGVFQRYFPMEDKLEKKEEFWIWDMEGKDVVEQEKNLLEKIYLYFRESWTRWELLGKDPGLTEPMAVGFGITRLDIPVLFVRSLVHGIANPKRLYDTYFKLRHFDLSVASAPALPESRNRKVLAPVSQNWAVRNLLGDGRRKPSGTTVWELYDAGEYRPIMERTREEVELARKVYQELRKLRNGLHSRP